MVLPPQLPSISSYSSPSLSNTLTSLMVKDDLRSLSVLQIQAGPPLRSTPHLSPIIWRCEHFSPSPAKHTTSFSHYLRIMNISHLSPCAMSTTLTMRPVSLPPNPMCCTKSPVHTRMLVMSAECFFHSHLVPWRCIRLPTHKQRPSPEQARRAAWTQTLEASLQQLHNKLLQGKQGLSIYMFMQQPKYVLAPTVFTENILETKVATAISSRVLVFQILGAKWLCRNMLNNIPLGF